MKKIAKILGFSLNVRLPKFYIFSWSLTVIFASSVFNMSPSQEKKINHRNMRRRRDKRKPLNRKICHILIKLRIRQKMIIWPAAMETYFHRSSV